MELFLTLFAFLMFLIAIILIVNEKFVKIPPEIALLAGSFVVGVLCTIILNAGVNLPDGGAISNLSQLKVDEILLDGILCFMLFSGARDTKLKCL